jgi:hypothetical protein
MFLCTFFAGGGSGFAQPVPAVRLLGHLQPIIALWVPDDLSMWLQEASIAEGSKFLEPWSVLWSCSQGKFRLKHTNSAKVPLLVIPR